MVSAIKIHTFTQEINCMKEVPYQCSKCETVFPPKALLLNYFKIIIGENPCDVSMYERSLQQVSRLVSHFITHKLEKSNHTKLSETTAYSSNSDIVNNDGINDKSDRECDNDGRDSDNSDLESENIESILKKSWTEVSGPRKRNYKCNGCGQIFHKKYILYKHLKSHNGLKQFVCSLCNKSFRNNYDISIHHKRFHTDEKPPHQCTECDKSFWQTKNLLVHVKNVHISKEQWPYKCEVCDARFPTQGRLTEHKKWHTGVKSHQCTYCGKLFVTTSHLKSHLKTHTDEKPFTCEQCGHSFKFKQTLLHHLETHSADRKKSYQCQGVIISFGALQEFKRICQYMLLGV